VRGFIAVSKKATGEDEGAVLALRLTEVDTAKGPLLIVTNVVGSRGRAPKQMAARQSPAVLPSELPITFRLTAPAGVPPRG
jgi:hypothetical protein